MREFTGNIENNNPSLCDALSSLPGLKLSVTVKPYYYEIEHLNPDAPPSPPQPPNFTNKLGPGPTLTGDWNSRNFFLGKNRNLNRLILAKPSQTRNTMEVSLIWCKCLTSGNNGKLKQIQSEQISWDLSFYLCLSSFPSNLLSLDGIIKRETGRRALSWLNYSLIPDW